MPRPWPARARGSPPPAALSAALSAALPAAIRPRTHTPPRRPRTACWPGAAGASTRPGWGGRRAPWRPSPTPGEGWAEDAATAGAGPRLLPTKPRRTAAAAAADPLPIKPRQRRRRRRAGRPRRPPGRRPIWRPTCPGGTRHPSAGSWTRPGPTPSARPRRWWGRGSGTGGGGRGPPRPPPWE